MTSTAIDLREYDGPTPPPTGIQEALNAFRADAPVPYAIPNDEHASWAMRKAAEARARIRDVQRVAEAELERIQQWAIDACRAPERDLAFFEHLLEEYALRERKRDPERKTITLPYGRIETRGAKPALHIEDTEAFLRWARTNAKDLIREVPATEVPDVNAIKKAVTIADGHPLSPQGEVVPGLAVTPETTTATVKPENLT